MTDMLFAHARHSFGRLQCLMCGSIWDNHAPQTHTAHAPSGTLENGLHPEGDWTAYATANSLTPPYPRYKTLDADPQNPPPIESTTTVVSAEGTKPAFERQVEYKKTDG